MSTSVSTIGERLREERKRLGLTQSELARRMGVHLNTQSRYEKCVTEPDSTYLDGLRDLGFDVGYIMGWGRKRTPEEILESAREDFKVGQYVMTDTGWEDFPDGEWAGRSILDTLKLDRLDWNALVDRMVVPNQKGIPCSDSRESGWVDGIVQSSGLIRDLIEEAQLKNQALLATVLEAFDVAQQRLGKVVSTPRKAQAVAMLYRAFMAAGKVDPALVEEAVKLAAD